MNWRELRNIIAAAIAVGIAFLLFGLLLSGCAYPTHYDEWDDNNLPFSPHVGEGMGYDDYGRGYGRGYYGGDGPPIVLFGLFGSGGYGYHHPYYYPRRPYYYSWHHFDFFGGHRGHRPHHRGRMW